MKKVKVMNTNAEKFTVSSVLTIGKEYDVVNETEEYIFIKDNTGNIGGFYKEYFEVVE
ncbi:MULTISPECIES: DUF6501 family protein [unclassified Gemella]|uniref:DUF6501 family protein n=1 Tax=unclassified Gemella TaxID=2624949 RepID=UPI001431442C|nr:MULTISPECIES: DUF6501 family protein [unclassified Gemella]MBF0710283.1 hypothetical protein [Gemella sp. GL1.1]MBF0746289.1 hypothetical protein [Gemella sp. 19428wG2_WT2a]MBF0846994.1 hypothetical protein [Streptococcus danieliae]NYS27627.1 hypothetical protein [Gemella sp. GL1]